MTKHLERRSLLTGGYTRVGDLRVFMRTGGPDHPEFPPVVCVHGAVISGRYMVPIAERLARVRRVMIPDLPGYGRTGEPRRPLNVVELARALNAFLTTMGVRRAHLLGNSLGAQIAAAYARQFPDRTASIILVGPTVDAAARTRLRQLWRLALDAPRERPSLIPLHIADTLRAGPRFALASLDIALADRIEENLAAIRSPVLIVSGLQDPLVPPEWSAALAARAPHARLEYLPGPHALNYSRPAELAPLVLDFLRSVEAD